MGESSSDIYTKPSIVFTNTSTHFYTHVHSDHCIHVSLHRCLHPHVSACLHIHQHPHLKQYNRSMTGPNNRISMSVQHAWVALQRTKTGAERVPVQNTLSFVLAQTVLLGLTSNRKRSWYSALYPSRETSAVCPKHISHIHMCNGE